MNFTRTRFIFILYLIPLCTSIINNYTNQDILDYFGDINYSYNYNNMTNNSQLERFII